jgi:hypothetical protein
MILNNNYDNVILKNCLTNQILPTTFEETDGEPNSTESTPRENNLISGTDSLILLFSFSA